MSLTVNLQCPKPIFSWNYWDLQPWEASRRVSVQLSCLMPNSIFLSLNADRDTTLAVVKNSLWMMAQKEPLSEQLLDKEFYVFLFIDRLAQSQEVSDETVSLRDLAPVGGVLRLQRRRNHDNGALNVLNDRIGRLIGKHPREFDALNNNEVDHFRAKINETAQKHAAASLKLHPEDNLMQRLTQLYPTRIASTLPEWLNVRLDKKKTFKVEIECVGKNRLKYNVAFGCTPYKLIEDILKSYKDSRNINLFLLKACGSNEYLTRELYRLVDFIYVQEILARDAAVRFVLVEKAVVSKELQEFKVLSSAFSTPSLQEASGKTEPSWKIAEQFRCTVLAVSKLNIDGTKADLDVEVQAGIYHGGKQLSGHRVTGNPIVSSLGKGVVRWTEELQFPIRVCDIPLMARLCFVVVEKTKIGWGSSGRKLYKNPLAWANTTIYEYTNRLKTGETTKYMWPYPDDLRTEHEPTNLLHPLGTVALNPNTYQCVTMTIRYGRYNTESAIAYAPNPELTFPVKNPDLICSEMKQKINQMKQNPFYEMHEWDWKDLWEMRMCLPELAPELLPKLLQCVEWGNPENVACLSHLLKSWPQIQMECALELLDYAYAEPAVRQFALKSFRNLRDDELLLYLFQLIQALKHESYLMCDLVQFLLNRAYKNLKIGHFLFWQLKSEMHNPAVSIRFGLILEGYLRGNQHHMDALMRQVNSLQKLIAISKMLRDKKDIDSARSELPKYLNEPHCSDAISQFANTLNPSMQCRRIIPEKCRVMDSKMRPMMLVFENADRFGDNICIIMKNGDDLRQDMFTLQIFRIMDQLWKNEGYDFRLNPYGCISMGDRVGMIEVVQEAQTIANIQKEKGTNGFKYNSILRWLKDHNTDENKAISEFMWSCAGYCVATYVLGVADRHSDNIMVKKNGQLFHIDFGHILGNFKEKFGFQRERVPFVLAQEFVNVIKDNKNDTIKPFEEFRELCEKAYLILRRHGMLIVSLFSCMKSVGLPELSSEEDLVYLQKTLALEVSESEAKKHFHSKFDEALKKDHYTMLNWWFHNRARNNN